LSIFYGECTGLKRKIRGYLDGFWIPIRFRSNRFFLISMFKPTKNCFVGEGVEIGVKRGLYNVRIGISMLKVIGKIKLLVLKRCSISAT